MSKIHWIGTGLSAVPGLRRLIENGHDVIVWNRTPAKAAEAVGDLTDHIKDFSMEAITAALQSGDILVSMLPGEWHVPLAELCLEKGANFVSSSYIAPEMKALDARAKTAGLALVNEVGLDPGIDHSMAHWLVADMKETAGVGPCSEISFVSYCGGIPKTPNPFRYKFSWAPVGVLKALRSPSKSLKDFKEWDVNRPWGAITTYNAPLPKAESFEVYPNRDSLPFMADYQFSKEWSVKEFVRGTLRLDGWAKAWDPVFKEIETLEGPSGDLRLQEMADAFLRDNAYADGEPDRVVLFVALKAEQGGATVYNKTYVMDAWGDARGTAMARLVSIPVSLAVEAVLAGEINAGVSAAPSNPALVDRWMETVQGLAQHLEVVDHLA